MRKTELITPIKKISEITKRKNSELSGQLNKNKKIITPPLKLFTVEEAAAIARIEKGKKELEKLNIALTNPNLSNKQELLLKIAALKTRNLEDYNFLSHNIDPNQSIGTKIDFWA